MPEPLSIPVRRLVEYSLRSGDLRAGFTAAGRQARAIRAHQRIQKSRPDGYQAEVTVSGDFTVNGLGLNVGGRIDGVFEEEGRTVIEEIKTVTGAALEEDEADIPLHWGQVKSYAHLYAEQEGLSSIDIQLTYHHLDTGASRTDRRRFTTGELSAFFDDLLTRFAERARKLADWETVRNGSIRSFDFPYGGFRAGQREMAAAVYRGIRDGGHTLIQAPTGIGKTAATLFPACKALGESLTSKIWFLAARTTGKTAAVTTIAHMRLSGLRLKSVVITAKNTTCPHPDAACLPEECPRAKGHFDRINAAVDEAFTHDNLDRETIETIAATHNICPFELSLELAESADCIICDYNYVFDPRVALRRFFAENTGNMTVLVDEAHNFVDRSRDMYSAVLTKEPVLELRRLIKKQLPGIHSQLGRINSLLAARRRKAREMPGGSFTETGAPAALLTKLRTALKSVEKWLVQDIRTPWREHLLEFYFQAQAFVRVSERFDDTYVTLYQTAGKELTVTLLCRDPSPQTAETLGQLRSAAFFSATLVPQDFFARMFGCPGATRLTLPSPFPREHVRVLAAGISTLYRHRPGTCGDIACLLTAFVGARKGNYLVYCPSYAYLGMLEESFRETAPGCVCIAQHGEQTEAEREEFIGRFTPGNEETLVGFAVTGGVFAEGIDLVGERLCGVAIIGVGLPGLSAERDTIRGYFDSRGENGFDLAYRVPGMNKVLQAAGRLIRSETDRGMLLLVDSRFMRGDYRALMPHEWLPEQTVSPADCAAKTALFWNDTTTDGYTEAS